MLIREVHHRVKNNLQVTVSLLRMQKDTLTEATAVDAVGKAVDRVQAMSLVHEQLYWQDDLARVNPEHYLDELVQYVLSNHDRPDMHPILEVNAPPLNPDTMIPLGIIVNELVTNSARHVPGQETPVYLYIILTEDRGRFQLEYRIPGRDCPQVSTSAIGPLWESN